MATKRERKALAEKVRAAADYVDRVGLFKGNFFDHKQARRRGVDTTRPNANVEAVGAGVRCCTMGALFGHEVYGVIEPLEKFLAETHPRSVMVAVIDDTPCADIPGWNDTKSRRKKDVVELLRGFADKLEKEQA